MQLDFPRWKIWATLITILIGIMLAVPNFFPKSVTSTWPSFVPTARFNYGLDLQGGSHLLLEAETSDVAKQKLEAMEEVLRTEFRRATPRIEIGDMSSVGGKLSFFVRDVAQLVWLWPRNPISDRIRRILSA